LTANKEIAAKIAKQFSPGIYSAVRALYNQP
jgi:hypothetical protein